MMKKTGDEAIVDLMTQNAQRRRAQALEDYERTLKDEFIIEVAQTEVLYRIYPSYLPFAQVDLKEFGEKLNGLYKLTRKDSRSHADDPLDAFLKPTENAGALEFVRGKFMVSKNDFVAINSLTLTREVVHVNLSGPSFVADSIIPDVVEQLWASAGASKLWPDIEKHVQLKSFGCSTVVDLGFPLMRLLSDNFRSYLDGEWIKGQAFASKMMPLSAVNDFAVSKNFIASYVVDDVNLLFNVYDPQSGMADRLKLKIGVTAKHQYGSNQCLVTSELPYGEHIEAIKLLRGLK